MAAPTNLYQYYTGLGQRLPSVSSLAPTYAKAGGTGNYLGTAQQNGLVLNYLLKNGSGGGTPAPAAANSSPTSPGGAAPGTNTFSNMLAGVSPAFSALSQQESGLISGQQSLNNAQTADLEQRLKENAQYGVNAINTNNASLGLLQSGATTNAVAGLQRDVANQLNMADIQNSINNANLALQGATFNTSTVLPSELSLATGAAGGSAANATAIANLLQSPTLHLLGNQGIADILTAYGLTPGDVQNVMAGATQAQNAG